MLHPIGRKISAAVRRISSTYALSTSQANLMAPKLKPKPMAPTPEFARDEAYLAAVIDKRIRLFTQIQAQQQLQRLSIGGDPIKITLPDGAVKEGKKWITTPLDIAKEISAGLAAKALIARVNDVLWDMSRPLEGDCELKLFQFKDNEGRDTFWHSSAHILGQSLEQVYGCRLCIGPCTTRGEGFYYDAFYNGLTLNEDHFEQIQSQARKAVAVCLRTLSLLRNIAALFLALNMVFIAKGKCVVLVY